MRTAMLLLTLAVAGCSSGPGKAPANVLETGSMSTILPDGSPGSVFTFMAKGLDRPVRIVHLVDGRMVDDLAFMEGIPGAEWVVLTLPDDGRTLSVLGYGISRTLDLLPADAVVSSQGGMSSANCRPSDAPCATSKFLERHYRYSLGRDGPQVEVTHAFHVLYGAAPGLRGATRDVRRRIQKVSMSDSLEDDDEYQLLLARRYADADDSLILQVLVRARQMDLVPFTSAFKYESDIERAGRVSIDGVWIDQTDRPQLWVNGPYGKLVRIELNQSEIERLASLHRMGGGGRPALQKLWDEVVDPKLYQYEGEYVDGRKDGPWAVRLADGTLYMKGEYGAGRRTGRWTVYYPDGTVFAQAGYADGELDGEWVVRDREGNVEFQSEWRDGRPLKEPVTWQVFDHSATVQPLPDPTPAPAARGD